MKIGRKLYYEKLTGNVLVDTGERQGSVVETTTEQDFQMYQQLQNYVQDQVAVIQLEYGAYQEEFTKCTGYSIDPATEEIRFDYTQKTIEETQRKKTLEEKLAEQELLLIDAYEAIAMLHEELETLKGESV